jgi:TonB family protein
MSYQALLFCPDEKTARVVSQVLSELEFHVEPCNEPFAAVKKLMAQHFDAIVVDCDNEQNAALLFKSARNSNSNQASLAVAVVEGQTGVAKAFRIGANLVLTKPIHVEQSKGTLRVARGLLRKGQAAKPVPGSSTPAESPAAQQPAFSAPSFSAPSGSAPSFPAPFASAPASSAQFAAQHSSTPSPMASASAFELDAEPAPLPDAAEATLLEYMPDSAPSKAESSPHAAADTSQSKQYPWQPRSKPQAEPMASALRRAAEVAGKSEFEAAAPSPTAASMSNSSAAAAPARAKEAPARNAGVIASKPAVKAAPPLIQPEIVKTAEPVSEGGWDSNSPSVEEIRVSSLGENLEQQASGTGGTKRTRLLVLALLGIAAAGYFGWTKMQPTHPQPVPQAVAPANLGTATLPPQAAPSTTDAQPQPDEVVAQPAEQSLGTPAATPSAKPSAAVVAEVPGVKGSVPVRTPAVANDVTVIKAPGSAQAEPSQTLMVRNAPVAEPKTAPEVEETEQAPAATSITTDTSSNVLSGLVNTNALNVQKAPAQTLRISQGVSQGLILKRVQPDYPAQARQMRLEGRVELQANISKTGSISAVKQLSGDGILGRAAIDAVRQWKYKPYYLNGEPIEIQTQITVNFKLP